MDIRKFLMSMSDASGVSGHEGAIAERLAAETPWCDSVRQDRLGNLVMYKAGYADVPRPKIMLAAHMDEIGLTVTKIEDEGFLRFDTIGGFDQRVLLGQEVTVHGSETLTGIIGAKPPHVQTANEQKEAVKRTDLMIDIGCDSAEASRRWVTVGDLVTLRSKAEVLRKDRIAGKAMDDRAGVAALLETLKELQLRKHSADVYAVATVQEEVGLRGAMTSTFGIVPDLGIAIDVGHGDMPDVKEAKLKLGGGPGIALGPHVHPQLFKRLAATAKQWSIPHAIEPSPQPRGTDTYAMQLTQAGLPTALLSIPLRYMHTPVETVDYQDCVRIGQLLAAFISELDHSFVEALLCY